MDINVDKVYLVRVVITIDCYILSPNGSVFHSQHSVEIKLRLVRLQSTSERVIEKRGLVKFIFRRVLVSLGNEVLIHFDFETCHAIDFFPRRLKNSKPVGEDSYANDTHYID